MGFWDNMVDYYGGGRADRKYVEETRKKTARKQEENAIRQANIEARQSRYNQVPSIGYHPQLNRMTIRTHRNIFPSLVCHYDPKEFVEKYTAEWEKVPVTGSVTTPLTFKFVRPREWSMKLLFNTLGGDPSRGSPRAGVDDELERLESYFLPTGSVGVGSVSSNGDRPPVLLVSLIPPYPFRCCLTGLIVTRKAIHPVDRYTTRAEVDVVFTEFVESSR